MPKTPNQPRYKSTNAGLRPGLDMVTAKQQAGKFPSIGMALPNYQYDPSDRYKRAEQTVVKKPGMFSRMFGWLSLKRFALGLVIIAMLVDDWLGYKFI